MLGTSRVTTELDSFEASCVFLLAPEVLAFSSLVLYFFLPFALRFAGDSLTLDFHAGSLSLE